MTVCYIFLSYLGVIKLVKSLCVQLCKVAGGSVFVTTAVYCMNRIILIGNCSISSKQVRNCGCLLADICPNNSARLMDDKKYYNKFDINEVPFPSNCSKVLCVPTDYKYTCDPL